MARQEPHITYTGAGMQVNSYGSHPQQQPLAVSAAEAAMASPDAREAMKQQAMQLGGQAMVVAKHYGHQGLIAFQDYIQQGPEGVSTLCFIGGAATCALGVLTIFNLGNIMVDPFHYILSTYTFAFGLATTCIEADTDRIGTLIPPFDRLAEPVTRAQAWLHEECKLLTELRGRGFFYLYQGTLMVTQCMFCFLFLGGLYNVLMGFVCIAMSFGMKPDLPSLVGKPYYQAVPDAEDGSTKYVPSSAVPSGSIAGNPAATFNSTVPGVNLAAEQEAEREFKAAEMAWQESKDRLPGKASRELWAIYQQATVGDCNEPKPTGMFNGNAKERWRLWNTRLRGVPPAEAKATFVQRLRTHKVDF